MTALAKPEGGVRGIATGCSLRRLVARTLARQFAQDFEKECAPLNGIYPAPDIHEQFMIHNGYGTLRTSSRTTSTTLSAL